MMTSYTSSQHDGFSTLSTGSIGRRQSRAVKSQSSRARPKTSASTTAYTETRNLYCATCESRGTAPTVGLAFVNLVTGDAILSQICDSQTYVRTVQKLCVHEPSHILVSASIVAAKTKMYQIVQDVADELGANVVAIDRSYWAETKGLNYMQHLAITDDIEAIQIPTEGNYFAVCCIAAVLKHIEVSLARIFSPRSLRIRYEPSEGSMMIDMSTIRALELIENLQDSKSDGCLFGLLNKTLTPMGSRLLRSNILQPLTDAEILELRYEAVHELSTREDTFFSTRQALKGFLDADKLLTALVVVPASWTINSTERSVNDVIKLKQLVSSVKPIFEALAGVSSVLLEKIRRICNPDCVEVINNLIHEVINEDTAFARQPVDLRNQRTYAMKSGVNGLLDVARQTYTESIADAYQHAKDVAKKHDLTLEIQFDNVRQFYMRIPMSELEDRSLPEEFVNSFRRKKSTECQTLELKKINQKVIDSHNEVLLMSSSAVEALLDDIRQHISALFKISESVAMLDMLASLACLATTEDYVRPRFEEVLAIKSGRHPIRDRAQVGRFIPNDVYASRQSRFQIVTGTNMSGKSTYIRSVALMAVMAQIGSFVPAQYASFPILRQLFARTSTEDPIESNVSTFALEMREMAFILRNVDEKSMIIVDELGRGTSTRDGLAIALATAENSGGQLLIDTSKALVWFATHFLDIARVMNERLGVKNLHLTIKSRHEDEVVMLYKVAEGPARALHYGLALARTAPLDAAIIHRARQVAVALIETDASSAANAAQRAKERRRKLICDLTEELGHANTSTLEADVLLQWLNVLKHKFVERMSSAYA